MYCVCTYTPFSGSIARRMLSNANYDEQSQFRDLQTANREFETCGVFTAIHDTVEAVILACRKFNDF